jgi:DNA repair ATPase RecN
MTSTKTKAELQAELDEARQALKAFTSAVKGDTVETQDVSPVATDTTVADKLRVQLKNVTEQLDKAQNELAVVSAERDAQQKAIEKIESKLVDLYATVNNSNVKPAQGSRDPWFVGLVIVTVVSLLFVFFFTVSEIQNRYDTNRQRQTVILKQSMADVSYNSRPLNVPEQWNTLASKLKTLAASNPSTLQVALGEIRFYLELVDQGNTWDTWRKNVGTKLTEEVNKDPSKLQQLLTEAAEGLSR